MALIKLPRLAVNWQNQPEMMRRYWDQAMNIIENIGAFTGSLVGGLGINFNPGTGVIALDTSSTRNTDHASVSVVAGNGLTGGGDISISRTFNVGAGTGITVNADDISLTNTAVSAGSYGTASQVSSFTVDAQGRLTAAVNTPISLSAGAVSGVALTKTDDTNVTLTLGGSPSTSLLTATSLTLGWTGTLALARGGTGSSTASGARTNLGLGTAATANTGTSGSTVPLLNTSNTWSATQAISRDGAAAAADLILTSDAGQHARVRYRTVGVDRWLVGKNNAAGEDYAIARHNDAGTAVGTALAISRSTGTVTLEVALPAASGGTGQSSYAVGDLLYASTTTALSKLADVATGNALISGGVGVAPSWGKIGISTHVSGLGTNVATFLGTPSSANLAAAITDETGSGALVFGTSPTLTTPSLASPTISGSSGNLYTGTYTPTLTNTANVSSSAAYVAQYMRVGDTVTVSGKVDVQPTANATITILGISLPIASNLANENECCGTGAAIVVAGQSGGVRGNTTSDRAELVFVSQTNTNQAMFFTFTYRII